VEVNPGCGPCQLNSTASRGDQARSLSCPLWQIYTRGGSWGDLLITYWQKVKTLAGDEIFFLRSHEIPNEPWETLSLKAAAFPQGLGTSKSLRLGANVNLRVARSTWAGGQ
jgi:hypothetical protein